MAADQFSEANTVMQMANCECYHIRDGGKELVATGLLQLLSVSSVADGDGAATPIVGLCFLRCGDDFLCPLPGQHVPCLRTMDRHYVLPLPGDEFYGIVLPAGIPVALIDAFERHLAAHTDFGVAVDVPAEGEPEEAMTAATDTATDARAAPHEADPPPPYSAVPPRADADSDHETGGGDDVKGDAAKDDSSLALVVATDPSAQAPSAVAHAMTRTAVGITTGSKVVGDTIVSGAGYLGRGLKSGGRALQRRLTPNEEATEFSETTMSRLHRTRQATGVAVKVSGVIVKGVIALAKEIGKSTAALIGETEYGQKFHAGTTGPKAAAAKEVGKSAVSAVAVLFTSLDRAGHILASDISSATTDVVSHKYGEVAGQAVNDTLGIAGNVTESVLNVKSVGIKPLVLVAAQSSAKEILDGGKGDEAEAIEGGSGADDMNLLLTVGNMISDRSPPPANNGGGATAAVATNVGDDIDLD